jgi:hypothetical protein
MYSGRTTPVRSAGCSFEVAPSCTPCARPVGLGTLLRSRLFFTSLTEAMPRAGWLAGGGVRVWDAARRYCTHSFPGACNDRASVVAAEMCWGR